MATEVAERRRIAIIDGTARHDLLIPLDATLNDALRTLGIRPEVGRDVLMERDGREVSPLLRVEDCLLYTSPSPRDRQKSRMPSSA